MIFETGDKVRIIEAYHNNIPLANCMGIIRREFTEDDTFSVLVLYTKELADKLLSDGYKEIRPDFVLEQRIPGCDLEIISKRKEATYMNSKNDFGQKVIFNKNVTCGEFVLSIKGKKGKIVREYPDDSVGVELDEAISVESNSIPCLSAKIIRVSEDSFDIEKIYEIKSSCKDAYFYSEPLDAFFSCVGDSEYDCLKGLQDYIGTLSETLKSALKDLEEMIKEKK